jgi:hypothetical protein
MATESVLLDVHDEAYIRSLHRHPHKVASVVELGVVALLPMCIVERCILRSMRMHVGGTMLTVGLAAQRGWAINIGGGMHHASHDNGVPLSPQQGSDEVHRKALHCTCGARKKRQLLGSGRQSASHCATLNGMMRAKEMCWHLQDS